MPKILGSLLILALVYVLLYVALNRTVYYPMKYPRGFWEVQKTIGAEDVWLRTADGVRIHGWWVDRPGTRIVTIFFHGNAGNLTHRVHHTREITAAGSSLLIIDYRGYGKSGGWPREQGLYADADAAYRYALQRGWRPQRIVAHGESLGTAVAVDLAVRQRCGGVVLEAPFTSARDVAARVLPLAGPLLTSGFDSRRKIPEIRVPLLIIHGDRDEVIDFSLGRDLFEAAREPKTFWAVPGAGHNNLVEAAGPAYGEHLRVFYESLGS